MFDEDTLADESRQKTDWLVVPQAVEGASMRGLMQENLERLVRSHNDEMAEVLHYIETGEVLGQAARIIAPYLDRREEKTRNYAKEVYLNRTIDLGYVLYSLDGFSQKASLDELDDLEFLEVYNRVLLQLRAKRLPDPMPY